MIEIPELLIEACPDMRLKSSLGPIRPAPGLHFGSRVVCDPPEHSYESVSAKWYPRIRNRSDFWGAYALDVWTERYDERQVIFRHCKNSDDLQAVFIDHGNSITSRDSSRRSGTATCLYPDKHVYAEHEMADEIEEWIARIQSHGLSAIANAYAQLPSDWQTASVEAFAHQLINRMEELPEVIFPSIPKARRLHHGFAKSATVPQSVRRVA